MTIKLESLLVDTAVESEGEWIPVEKWQGLNKKEPYTYVSLPGLEFRVRSLNSSQYRTAQQRLAEEFDKKRALYEDGVIPAEVADAMHGKVIAQHLLLGWKGLDMEYSPEVAEALLQKPAGRIFREMIVYCAAKVGKRNVEFLQEEEDNLGKPHNGPSGQKKRSSSTIG